MLLDSAAWAMPTVRWVSRFVTSVAMVAVATFFVALVHRVSTLSLAVVYMLVVVPVAVAWGTVLAVVISVLSVAVFEYQFVPPAHSLKINDVGDGVALGVFLVTAITVGRLAARVRREAQASARMSEEQSALRRVATLVARSAPPAAVFQAVTREVGLLCGADLARLERYEPDGSVTGVAVWSRK